MASASESDRSYSESAAQSAVLQAYLDMGYTPGRLLTENSAANLAEATQQISRIKIGKSLYEIFDISLLPKKRIS